MTEDPDKGYVPFIEIELTARIPGEDTIRITTLVSKDTMNTAFLDYDMISAAIQDGFLRMIKARKLRVYGECCVADCTLPRMPSRDKCEPHVRQETLMARHAAEMTEIKAKWQDSERNEK